MNSKITKQNMSIVYQTKVVLILVGKSRSTFGERDRGHEFKLLFCFESNQSNDKLQNKWNDCDIIIVFSCLGSL